jgi:rhodanese-related sulfurtransferase
MKNPLVFLVVPALFVLLSASGARGAEWTEINAAELKKMMDGDDALVVFPLSRIEFNDLHIKGAVNIPILWLRNRLPKNRNKKIVFYCLGGKSMGSVYAAGVAAKLGYRSVYIFRDGLPGWIEAGYPAGHTQRLPDIKPPAITAAALKDRLDGGGDFVLLDVRVKHLTRRNWIRTHNRLYIPLYKLNGLFIRIPRDKDIVVMDEDGERSPVAVRFLLMNGFESVSYVEGGIRKWMSEGYPVASRHAKR